MAGSEPKMTFLVLGASGGTGKHFVTLALHNGHRVKAFVRSPEKLRQLLSQQQPAPPPTEHLDIVQGSITDPHIDFDGLTSGVDAVICMLGDREAQKTTPIVTNFLKRLVPAMRTNGVKKLLYQAGAMSSPPDRSMGLVLWALRQTLGRSFDGQHRDNEAAMRFLLKECEDIEWMAHLSGIGSDGPSKGRLERSHKGPPGIGTHGDCAEYSYRLIRDPAAVHTCDYSSYARG